MQCKDCKFWQGHRHQKTEADCYRVIGALFPELDDAVRTVYDDSGNELYEEQFPIPFDPHDLPKWRHVKEVGAAMRQIRRSDATLGEIRAISDYPYLKTPPDMKGCKFFESRRDD